MCLFSLVVWAYYYDYIIVYGWYFEIWRVSIYLYLILAGVYHFAWIDSFNIVAVYGNLCLCLYWYDCFVIGFGCVMILYLVFLVRFVVLDLYTFSRL